MSKSGYPYCFDFTPGKVKALFKIDGQWKILRNGDVRCWYSEAQWRDIQVLASAVLNGESNEFTEESNGQIEYALPDF